MLSTGDEKLLKYTKKSVLVFGIQINFFQNFPRRYDVEDKEGG